MRRMNKLVEFVENYRKSNPTGWRRWVYGTIAVVIVLVLVTVFGIREALRQRDIANLKHERDVLKQTARASEVDAELATIVSVRQTHQDAADVALGKAEELEDQVKELEARSSASSALIESLKSWDDVDDHVR